MTEGHSKTCYLVCPLRMKVEMRVNQPFVGRTQPEIGRTALGTWLEYGITKNVLIKFVGLRTEYA